MEILNECKRTGCQSSRKWELIHSGEDDSYVCHQVCNFITAFGIQDVRAMSPPPVLI